MNISLDHEPFCDKIDVVEMYLVHTVRQRKKKEGSSEHNELCFYFVFWYFLTTGTLMLHVSSIWNKLPMLNTTGTMEMPKRRCNPEQP